MLMRNQPSTLTRPGTLALALQFALGQGEALRYCLAGFLDEFYADPDSASRRARIEEEPALLGDEKQDAFIGAIAEHLCHRWSLGDPPAWTNDPRRFLHQPWFVGP